jgi:hypothetical protein
MQKLFAYLIDQPSGAELSYLQIEHDTGVRMDDKGKASMRQAVKECERTYKPLRGQGIWLDSVDNATDIVEGKVKRVRGAMVKVTETITIVRKREYDLLPLREQRMIDQKESFLRAALAIDKQGNVFTPPRKELKGKEE